MLQVQYSAAAAFREWRMAAALSTAARWDAMARLTPQTRARFTHLLGNWLHGTSSCGSQDAGKDALPGAAAADGPDGGGVALSAAVAQGGAGAGDGGVEEERRDAGDCSTSGRQAGGGAGEDGAWLVAPLFRCVAVSS